MNSYKTCQGKAIFVITGSDVTIRKPDPYACPCPRWQWGWYSCGGRFGRREEPLHQQREWDLLAADAPESTIRILDSEFTHNGKCQNACAHGIYVGHIALLHIEGTKFFDTRDGHHIKSRAVRTELVGNDIEDGPNGTSSYLVDIPNGGTLIMENNVLEKGPHSSNHSAAVVIGAGSFSSRSAKLVFKNNSFSNDGGSGDCIRSELELD